jgi:predicted Zn finger-like uncharacterized protein
MVLKSCCEVGLPMLIVCPSCAASYDVTPARLQSSGPERCTRCGEHCRTEQALLTPVGIDVDYGGGGTHWPPLRWLSVNWCELGFGGVATSGEEYDGLAVLSEQGNIAGHIAIRFVDHRGIVAEMR